MPQDGGDRNLQPMTRSFEEMRFHYHASIAEKEYGCDFRGAVLALKQIEQLECAFGPYHCDISKSATVGLPRRLDPIAPALLRNWSVMEKYRAAPYASCSPAAGFHPLKQGLQRRNPDDSAHHVDRNLPPAGQPPDAFRKAADQECPERDQREDHEHAGGFSPARLRRLNHVSLASIRLRSVIIMSSGMSHGSAGTRSTCCTDQARPMRSAFS